MAVINSNIITEVANMGAGGTACAQALNTINDTFTALGVGSSADDDVTFGSVYATTIGTSANSFPRIGIVETPSVVTALSIIADSNSSFQFAALANGSIVMSHTGATGELSLSLSANLADAWSITDGTNDLLVFVTTTGATSVTPVAGIGAAGGFTASPRNCHTGGVPAQATTDGTNAATNTAGTVYLAEVFVPCNCTATGVAIFNGTAVAGNGKVMLYDSAGNRLAISASTAMSGTTAYQRIPFTAALAVKGPATYFIGAIYDNTAHDLRGHTLGSFAAGEDAGNTYGTESTYATVTLPTTFATTTGPIASLY